MVRWAQSLFALAKQGRRFALACLLVKLEVGVQDAWVRDDMTKAEADDLIAQIVAGAEAVEISIGLLEQRLADALSINVARDVPPPFGLLQVAETLALGPLHPNRRSAARAKGYKGGAGCAPGFSPMGGRSSKRSPLGSRRARPWKGFFDRYGRANGGSRRSRPSSFPQDGHSGAGLRPEAPHQLP